MNIYSSNKTISEQFDSLDKLPMFEIEVIDKRTNEQEYIIFNISLLGSKFMAEHIAMNQEQEDSYKIAYCSIVSSNWLTLDENLEELYFECIEAINNSEFYELPE
jgi:chromosome condensin MukBEF ATPase and DNA-binding subunit MukB